jgi:hypothetical protein
MAAWTAFVASAASWMDWKPATTVSLNGHNGPVAVAGRLLKLPDQHSLTHASDASHYRAAHRTTYGRAFHGVVEVAELLRSAS